MTNSLTASAPICCPTGGGGDLMPLLIVVGAFFVAYATLKEFKKRKGKPEMKNLKNLVIVAVVVMAVAAVFALKQNRKQPADSSRPVKAAAAALAEVVPAASDAASPATPVALPRLLDLGADKCIPCKMMAPVLEDLKTAYAGQLQVEFIDVWKNPEAGDQYGVRIIPLQIFFDAEGEELFRHEGFFAKEDILAQWKELGVSLATPAPQTP